MGDSESKDYDNSVEPVKLPDPTFSSGDIIVTRPGYSAIPTNEDLYFPGEVAPYIAVDTGSNEMAKYYKVFYTPIECVHEPIDVGFAQTKMVCKKCDKDL